MISGNIICDGPLVANTDRANPDDCRRLMERLRGLPVQTVRHFPGNDGARHREIFLGWLNRWPPRMD